MQLPMPDDWDKASTCRWAICWPDSPKWRAILSGLIESPMQGRLWDFKTGDFLELREDFRPIYDYNFNLKEVIMACNDSGLADAFNNIAEAISKISVSMTNNNSGGSVCCEQTIINQNGFLQGTTIAPGSGESIPIFGSQPPLSNGPEDIPDGYETREEFDLDRCQVANLVVDGFISTLRGLGAIGVFDFIALAGLIVATIAGAIIFPPSAIPIACAALGFLATEVTLLTVLANAVADDRETWVCELYNSESVETAMQVVSDLLDGILAAIPVAGRAGFFIKQIALLLLNSDTLNQLQKKVAHLQYPDADCSSCVSSHDMKTPRSGRFFSAICLPTACTPRILPLFSSHVRPREGSVIKPRSKPRHNSLSGQHIDQRHHDSPSQSWGIGTFTCPSPKIL